MARHTTSSTATRMPSGGARDMQTRPAGETVTATLAAHPGRTAAELAQLAGLGTSTVTKALAALEKASQASRHIPDAPGSGGRRPAARWQPIPTPPADTEPPAAQRHRPTTKNRTTTTPPTEGRSNPEATAGTAVQKARTGRLGRGELGTLVLQYLLAHPDSDLGPTAVGAALQRSQGAVANCLTKLAASGDLVQTSDKPRRYRLTS